MKTRSSFTYQSDNEVISITDLNRGMSVTNDMENVLNYIINDMGIEKFKPKKIMYRDSEGMWDSVKPIYMNDRVISVDFIVIQQRDFETAKRVLLNTFT